MKTLGKIVCRTIGTLGVGIALYDATKVSAQFSRNEAHNQQAKYLEKSYYNSRTIDTVSYSSNNIRKKTFDLETRNPLPALWGKLKGGFEGFFYSLGESLFGITCSAFALLSKGTLAKIGAAGVTLGVCYKVLREGFGLGKQHPMD